MKKLKLKFSGMGGRFNPEDNFIINILRKRYRVSLSENPDLLFYSVNSSDYLKYKCPRIFYTAENLVPDFNICDYAIGFHYLDFGDRYFRYPLYLVDGFMAYDNDNYAKDLQLALHKHERAKEYLAKKTEFCAFVYSNGEAAKCRENFFAALSAYKRVNSGGRYKNNIGGPVDSKLAFQTKHKFVIAFENTQTPGYTTEKLVQAFAAGAIPIYWGDPAVTKVFSSKAFINCNEYGVSAYGDNTEAFSKIIDRVRCLDENEDEYLRILSQPAFVKEYRADREQKKFEKFLFHIAEQEPEKIYRRNRYYWGERYERKQRIGNWFYWQLRKLIPIRDGIKKLFNKLPQKLREQ